MASSLDFVEFVCDQISDAGNITYKKMFGEFGVYCNAKIIGLICDSQFFVKITENGANILPNCEKAPPYAGAKPYFLVENLEDRELITKFITATYDQLPAPKPKKKK